MMPSPVYRVGTRGSQLAQTQTRLVIAQLQALGCSATFEVEVIESAGDRFPEKKYLDFSSKGIFVGELEAALQQKKIDFAVHSAKDLPTEATPGLLFCAVLARESPSDVLVGRDGITLDVLKTQGGRVGTSSFRRQAQLRAALPKMTCVPLRGNVETRLRKVMAGEVDAMVVAQAGLDRLRLGCTYEVFPHTMMLPAVGQGILVVQGREEGAAQDVLTPYWQQLHHPASAAAWQAERACLAALGGGCHTPIAAYAQRVAGALQLEAGVFSLDGTRVLRDRILGEVGMASALGTSLAERLSLQGAKAILVAEHS